MAHVTLPAFRTGANVAPLLTVEAKKPAVSSAVSTDAAWEFAVYDDSVRGYWDVRLA